MLISKSEVIMKILNKISKSIICMLFVVLLSTVLVACGGGEDKTPYRLYIKSTVGTMNYASDTITSTIGDFSGTWSSYGYPDYKNDSRYKTIGFYKDEAFTQEFSASDFKGDMTIYAKLGVDGVDFEYSGDTAYAKSKTDSTVTDIFIPEEINGFDVELKEGAFKDNTVITKVTIEETDVSVSAFDGASALRHVVLESKFIEIHDFAFARTTDIKVAYNDNIDSNRFVSATSFLDATNAKFYYTETKYMAEMRTDFHLSEYEGMIEIFFSGEYDEALNDYLPVDFFD